MANYVKSKVNSNSRIIFHGQSFGEKEFIFKKSKAFILPSISEGILLLYLKQYLMVLCFLTKECNCNKLFTLGSSIKIKKDTKNIRNSSKDF